MCFLYIYIYDTCVFSERDFRGNSISLIATNCADPETHNLRESLKGSSFGAEKTENAQYTERNKTRRTQAETANSV